MIVGTSQIEITPKPGVELSGFAARTQPSTGVLDPLFAKALYLACDNSDLLWIHCDLIGFERGVVQAFRRWAKNELGLEEAHVMLSATHTHAGPCTIHLREAGEYDAAYAEFLMVRLREAARAAVKRAEPCELISVEGRLNLAVDRRKTASAHTDPRVAALGFRRGDGTFAAAIVNYAVHPVALGPTVYLPPPRSVILSPQTRTWPASTQSSTSMTRAIARCSFLRASSSSVLKRAL